MSGAGQSGPDRRVTPGFVGRLRGATAQPIPSTDSHMGEAIVLPDWARLLDARDQPGDAQAAYELVAQFVTALGDACPLDPRDLYPAAAARTGYLMAAAKRFPQVRIDESWERLQGWVRSRQPAARDVELLVAEPGVDPYDELAAVWGIRRGLDPRKLRQIARSGTG